MGHAANTGDVTELTRLSAEDCEGCNRYIDYFTGLYDDGGSLKQSWEAPDESVVRFQPADEGESFVTTRVVIGPGMHKPSSTEKVRRTSGSRDKVTFALAFQGEWIVTQMWAGDYE